MTNAKADGAVIFVEIINAARVGLLRVFRRREFFDETLIDGFAAAERGLAPITVETLYDAKAHFGR